MHWEVWNTEVDGECNVRAQVAHFVGPSALGETSLTKCTTLRLKPPPAALMGYSCNTCKNKIKFTNLIQIEIYHSKYSLRSTLYLTVVY